MRRNSSIIFILVLIILGGLIFAFYNVWAKANGVTATVKITVCGDEIVEGPEECDPPGDVSDFRGKSCQDFGHTQGSLYCNIGCTIDTSACYTPSTPPSGGGGGGGGGGYVAPTETKVIIKGTAYPEAEITLLSDGKVEATKEANSLANFKFEITDITSGIYTFSLWALDNKGSKSITFSFTTNVANNMTTTVSGIFLPPTIELSKTKLQVGEILSIYGQTAPESKIEISVESPEPIEKITIANEEGDWEYPFSTRVLDDGLHTARAKATSPEGLLSSYSKVLNFYIGEGAPGIILNGDLNDDAKVNLVDFSILLYYWGTTDVRADQNGDGKVNLTDFSILLYYWTG